MRKIATKMLIAATALSVTAGASLIAGQETASAKKAKVKKVTVSAESGKTVQVAKGKKVKLTVKVKVKPNKKANKKVTYKSSSKKIATVSANENRKVGRNDPCPCGSGKKYKHCCGR